MYGSGSGTGIGNAVSGKGQSVPFTRTSTAVETVFTTTTVDFPKSAKATKITIVCTVAALVQVAQLGGQVYSIVVAPNVASVLDISGYPEATSLPVQTQLLAIGTIAGTASYV